jgi:hypothetical protein
MAEAIDDRDHEIRKEAGADGLWLRSETLHCGMRAALEHLKLTWVT